MTECSTLEERFNPDDMIRSQIDSAMLAAIVESSEDAIISKTLDGVITTWNRAAARIFGYSAAEAIGQPVQMLIPIDHLAEEDEILARLRRGERTEHLETVRLTKSGRLIHVSLSTSPVKDSSGRTIGASKIVRDITLRKQAEAAMQWQQSAMEHLARLNTMGEMAAGLAHELNQPLASILNYTGGLMDASRLKNMPADRFVSALKEIASETHRAGEIIRRLRDFIRKRDPSLEAVAINEIVQDSLHLLEHELRQAQIKLRLELAEDLPGVMADSIQLAQVLVNLLRNAKEAMTDPGAAARQLTISTMQLDDRVRIDVIDRGCGVSADKFGKLFERFYSTKAAGLGMGLAISKTIVESLGGELLATSNDTGGGMTFSILLPVGGGQGAR